MKPESLEFLHRLLDTPGPSGFERAPARTWRAEAESVADEVLADRSGNSLARLGDGNEPRVMFAGHIDEIGLKQLFIQDPNAITLELNFRVSEESA